MKSAKRVALAIALIALPALIAPATSSAAAPGPAWAISTAIAAPTNFTAGESTGEDFYDVIATNVGAKATDGSAIVLTDVLPAGLTVNPNPSAGNGLKFQAEGHEGEVFPCEAGPPAKCTITGRVLHPGEALRLFVPVNVAAGAPASITNLVSVSGGGAAAASDSLQSAVSSEAPPFGLQSFRSSLLDSGGAAATQAGSHPYQMRIAAQFNTIHVGSIRLPGVEEPRDISVDLPAGLVLNPRATAARCTEVQLETQNALEEDECPDASAVGVVHLAFSPFGAPALSAAEPIYNMVPPAGRPAEFAFNAIGVGFFIHLLGRVRSDGDYGLSSDTLDVPQLGAISGVTAELWGDPSDPSHDYSRGNCATTSSPHPCPVAPDPAPLITMPSACQGPLRFGISSDSWQHPGSFVSASVQTEEAGNPASVTGCDKLSYDPSSESIPSTNQAESGSGFDFNVDFPNNGFGDKEALAESTTEKAIVTLPEGLTINPSVGEGLGFCTPAQYAKETAFTIDGEGCPADSKLGTLHVDTPLLQEGIDGFVYLAQEDDKATTTPGAENPFDSLIALYLVLKNPTLGVIVKLPLKIEPDPSTGQLVATLEGIPQLPLGHSNFHFREGARAALVTPSHCGTYTTVAKLYPYADPTHPKTLNSSFEINRGVNGGPCPSGGLPPFHPEFQAGAVNNNAGAFSPFNLRLLRKDGEQDMTKFSSVLPPGELGSLAGVGKCPDSAIAAAKAKTGRQEEQSPSCPANSLIGHTLAGAGVGDSLTYVPGQLYLGGPYHGDPLSVISITPGVAGPFDAGTVVVQLALTLNSKTAEVEVDGAASDPIPHILKGIVLKVRDLRVYVDRPDFTLNPTSCTPSTVKGTLFGSYLNVFSPADDVPVGLSTRYQAADCQSLGYKPSIALQLKGGTKRGGHPGLLATYTAKKGDANTKGLVVRLPRSAFLDQSHIRTICTRVQFAAKSCPPAAQYGYIKAFTPLLDEPLEGPVWLRSSSHKLPDLVFDLHGLVDVEVSTRIDSANGGIRASIEDAPDAPLTKVVLRMQGGKKGLIVNSRNLCGATSKANVELEGHNGKVSTSNPVMKADCGGKRKHKRASH